MASISNDWEVVAKEDGSILSRTCDLGQVADRHDNDLKNVKGIFASILIPGKGKPRHEQAVIFEDGIIKHVGDQSSIPSKYSQVKLKEVPVLMPGMWECHSHFVGPSPNKPINSENIGMTSPVEAGARNVRALKDTLYAGFTSCVDLGGYAPELQKIINENLILGPTLYGAGAALSMTAGHGDVFEIPLGSAWQKLSVHAPGTEVGSVALILADGITECRKAVRMNLRRGARVTKVFTSGGVTSRDDDPLLQQFSDEELKVIVEESARMGLICAAHAIGKAGIMAAIRAGFKVIEHNSFADEEVFEAMKRHDVMCVATITPVQSVLDNKDKYPKEMFEKARKVAEAHKAAYRGAIKAGVKCALGSDLFGGTGTVLGPGLNGREVVYAVEGGMTPLEAIQAATAHGPDTLGPQAPKSGLIKGGYDADFLGLKKNPLDDIKTLSQPKDILYIWKQGKLVKAPGLDPWDALN